MFVKRLSFCAPAVAATIILMTLQVDAVSQMQSAIELGSMEDGTHERVLQPDNDAQENDGVDKPSNPDEVDNTSKSGERDEDAAPASSQPPSTEFYFKKGSLLHKVAAENKVNVEAAYGELKELVAKKKRAKDRPGKAKVIKDEMSTTIFNAASHQGSYYHKTGPVPQELRAKAHLKLTSVAKEVPTDKGDPTQGVPHSAMQIYRKAVIKAAVAIATKKAAELNHKKAVVEKLKADHAVPAEEKQHVLRAKVAAAERGMKMVLKKTDKERESSPVSASSDADVDMSTKRQTDNALENETQETTAPTTTEEGKEDKEDDKDEEAQSEQEKPEEEAQSEPEEEEKKEEGAQSEPEEEEKKDEEIEPEKPMTLPNQ